jgi:DNA-directed RNA polymerase specialized sigma24 family protein
MKEIRASGYCCFLVAFNVQELIDEFGPALARIAACHEPDPARRDELLEEIFLAIPASVPRDHDAEKLKTCLFRVAHNRATSFVQRLPRVPASPSESARETTPLDAVRELNMPIRLSITLLFENIGEPEIAQVLGVPMERVRLHIERGKQQLGVHFDELRESWCHLQVGFPAPRDWLLLRRRWAHLPLIAAMALAAAGTLAGLWLAFSAWRTASVPAGIHGVALLISAPVLASVAYLARKENLDWGNESPEGVLIAGRYRAERSLRVVRLGRGCVSVMASSVALLWVMQLGGLISAKEFLMFYSAAWAVLAVSYLPWLARREKHVYEERAITSRLLGEVTSVDVGERKSAMAVLL